MAMTCANIPVNAATALDHHSDLTGRGPRTAHRLSAVKTLHAASYPDSAAVSIPPRAPR